VAFPRGHLSYSQIRTFLICPRKYALAYVEESPAPLNDKLLLGTVFHAVLERYFSESLAGLPPTAAATEAFFMEEFKRAGEEQTVRWDDSPERVRKRGQALLRHFLKELASRFRPLMVEKELTAPLPGYPVDLRGVIDLVEEDLSITDFKTATARWSRSRTRHARLQMVIYHYLFEKNFGDVNSHQRFCVVYSRKGNSARSQILEMSTGAEDLEHLFRVIEHVAAGIQDARFPRNEGFRCGYCEYRDQCLGNKPFQRRNHEQEADEIP